MSDRDTSRPALLLIRVIAVATSFAYGILRLTFDDRSPMFGLETDNPQLEDLPYATNPQWAALTVVFVVGIAGYILAQTLWGGFRDYVKYGAFGISPTPWSVIFSLTLLSLAGVYYVLVALLVLDDVSLIFWPVFLTLIVGTLTGYEIRRKDV